MTLTAMDGENTPFVLQQWWEGSDGGEWRDVPVNYSFDMKTGPKKEVEEPEWECKVCGREFSLEADFRYHLDRRNELKSCE